MAALASSESTARKANGEGKSSRSDPFFASSGASYSTPSQTMRKSYSVFCSLMERPAPPKLRTNRCRARSLAVLSLPLRRFAGRAEGEPFSGEDSTGWARANKACSSSSTARLMAAKSASPGIGGHTRVPCLAAAANASPSSGRAPVFVAGAPPACTAAAVAGGGSGKQAKRDAEGPRIAAPGASGGGTPPASGCPDAGGARASAPEAPLSSAAAMSCAASLRLLHSFPTSEGPAAARVPVVCWWAAIMWRCRLG